jgi:hypothetical protein
VADEDTPLKRPIGMAGLFALVGVADAGYGLVQHRYLHIAVGLLLIVSGLTMGYRVWRAHRRRYDAEAAGRES